MGHGEEAKGPFERDWIKQRYLPDMQRAAGIPIEIVVGEQWRG